MNCIHLEAPPYPFKAGQPFDDGGTLDQFVRCTAISCQGVQYV